MKQKDDGYVIVAILDVDGTQKPAYVARNKINNKPEFHRFISCGDLFAFRLDAIKALETFLEYHFLEFIQERVVGVKVMKFDITFSDKD
jgi:hypothetical protein